MNSGIMLFKEPRALRAFLATIDLGSLTGLRDRALIGVMVGTKIRIGKHSLRATGITDYLKRDGSLVEARKMANHVDTCTMQLYDRRADAASPEEYGKVGI